MTYSELLVNPSLPMQSNEVQQDSHYFANQSLKNQFPSRYHEYDSSNKSADVNNTKQSFSLYRSNEEIGSLSGMVDSATKVLNGGTSLHSAQNLAPTHYNYQFSQIEPEKALSKTASLSQFHAYQNTGISASS